MMHAPLDWTSARFDWLSLVHRDHALPDAAKVLAAALMNEFANRTSGECWPSWATLAASLGWSERKVARAVAALESAGFLEVERGNGRGRQSRLRLGLFGAEAQAQALGNAKCSRKAARIIALSGSERVPNLAGQTRGTTAAGTAERVTELTVKGAKSGRPHYKEEPRREPRMRDQAREARPRALRSQKPHRLRQGETWLVNAWDRWLSGENLPPLCDLAREEIHEGRRHWVVPMKLIPQGEAQRAQARAFFAKQGLREDGRDVAA